MQFPLLRRRSPVLGLLFTLLALLLFALPSSAQANTAPHDLGHPVVIDATSCAK